MQFSTLLLSALAATTAVFAAPTQSSNPFSPVPNYPLGNGVCLTDAQANFLAEQFRQTLALVDRNAAAKLANVLFADSYTETSDSINILAGYPVSLILLHFHPILLPKPLSLTLTIFFLCM